VRPQYHLRNSDRGLLAWDVRRLIERSATLVPFDLPLDRISEIDEAFWRPILPIRSFSIPRDA
jgi:hypothetical protein